MQLLDTITYETQQGQQVTIKLYQKGKQFITHTKIGKGTTATRAFASEKQANDHICALQHG